jgi:hypothetical protein
MRARPSRIRTLAWSVTASVTLFAALMGIGIVAYPGGTMMDPRARGFDIARNFMCELVNPVAVNGEPNPVGSVAATLGMVVLILGVGVFWALVPALFPERRALGRSVRVLGGIGFASLLLIPVTTWLHLSVLHPIAIFGALVPSVLAALVATWGLAVGQGTRRLAVLGGVLLVTAVVDGILYGLYTYGSDGAQAGLPPPVMLPALQRVATVLLLLWLLAVARVVLRAAPRRQ